MIAGREQASVIDDLEIARGLHVLCIVHWIGGLAFVTLVALPLARARSDAAEGWALFEAIENRFAAQVRWSVPLAGLTGLWMVWRLGLWTAFGDPGLWWMDAMIALWALFALIVFVVEPLAHRRIVAMAVEDPAALLIRLSRAHRILLVAGVITIFGAVAGAHGGFSSERSSSVRIIPASRRFRLKQFARRSKTRMRGFSTNIRASGSTISCGSRARPGQRIQGLDHSRFL